MILSDGDIRKDISAGRIEIDPFDDGCVQPSSVDLHVDRQFRVFANSRYAFIDVPHCAADGGPDCIKIAGIAQVKRRLSGLKESGLPG